MKATLTAIRVRCEIVGDCWEWSGATNEDVPIMRFDGSRRLLQVRRVVLEIQDKPTAGLFSICTCRNPQCVSPKHTTAVTRSELSLIAARETQYGPRLTRRAAIAAARRGRQDAVLSLETVAEMKESNLTSRQAAKKYGVCQSTAASAMSGRAWRDYRAHFAGMVGALA